ncbi:uncharacterized protein LOC135476265 [Liolophura sinensis]|uniref:uncharacterized protein LOC135476265 n=1 Tax=Liolophura sinensis TaxID=3198878 RepID=UPI003158FFFC
MARSVRDLRELICVSRLTYHESDEEVLSDTDSSIIENDMRKLSLNNGSCNDIDNIGLHKDVHVSKKTSATGVTRVSPDSGFLTNSSTPSTSGSRDESQTVISPVPSGSSSSSCTKSPTKRKRKKKKNVLLTKHDLPKAAALPPVSGFHSISSNSQGHFDHSADLRQSFSFDSMLTYIDASIVANWLQRANENVTEMSRFCNYEDSFVQFAHFWLTGFPDVQRTSIYDMEYDILVDEFNLAFAVGRQSGKVTRKDIVNLLGAIYKEYPGTLLSSKGCYLFLNYMDVLSSDRTAEYKELLSDVKCSTKNKQYAQWLLAARSFALVNVWSAVLNFYRNLLGKTPVAGCLPLPSSIRLKNVHHQRMYQAIRADFVDVVHYLLKCRHVDPQDTDSHGRTWIFTAVMHNSANVLVYLLNRVKPAIDVNQSTDTGNTALHAAANQGCGKIAEILLQTPDILVNCQNPQCEHATPLHMAVMHGHLDVVKALVEAKADTTLRMGDLTPVNIAKDFNRSEIVQILTSSGC